ncbi:hypothetical protein CSIM01_07841 [Colletotrichum simmondsii]|uniref:Uncharacterized protein n=1 Tax=Colletotrichum simmondsii TaxID=703756 RepID=A0A135TVD5_9PEZI|nr:hypothetical protein CSIM01_07841 [Colletotrichum simmondsii]
MRPFALFLGACVGKISNRVGRSAMPWFLAIEKTTRLNRIRITCAHITFGRADWTNHPPPVVAAVLRLNSLKEVNLDFLPAAPWGPWLAEADPDDHQANPVNSLLSRHWRGPSYRHISHTCEYDNLRVVRTRPSQPNGINGASPGHWQRAADHYPNIAEFLSSLEQEQIKRRRQRRRRVPPERKAWPVVGSGYLPSPFDFRDGACRRRLVSTDIGSSSVRNRCQSTFSTRLSTTTITFGASSHHLTYRASVDGHMYPYAGYRLWIMVTGCSGNLDTVISPLSGGA